MTSRFTRRSVLLMEASAVPAISPRFAALFASRKADFVARVDDHSEITQTGAVYVDTEPTITDWPAATLADDAVIESFVLAEDGELTALGANDAFNAAWLPLVQAVARVVLDAVASHEIPLEYPAYITASTTPAPTLEGLAHLDDDLLVEDDGVGLVAICGALDGPRVACGSISVPPVRPGSQIVIDDEMADAFARGTIDTQHAEPGRVIVFPQFGQLHAGPVFPPSGGAGTRGLVVLRAPSRPLR